MDAFLEEVENDMVGLIRPNNSGMVLVSTLALVNHLKKPYI